MIEKEYRSKYPEKLRIYDISLDEYRDVTQEDVDRMVAVVQAYGAIRKAVSDAHSQAMFAINQRQT